MFPKFSLLVPCCSLLLRVVTLLIETIGRQHSCHPKCDKDKAADSVDQQELTEAVSADGIDYKKAYDSVDKEKAADSVDLDKAKEALLD